MTDHKADWWYYLTRGILRGSAKMVLGEAESGMQFSRPRWILTVKYYYPCRPRK